MKRTEKETTVHELRAALLGARSAVLTDYRGLNVAEMTELRTLLGKSQVEYRVVKNTLARLASQGTDLAPLAEFFRGPTAIAISRADPVAGPKLLAQFGKARPTFAVKAAVVEGKLVSAAEVAALAVLPPREALLGLMLGAFQAPLRALVVVLHGQIRALATALDAVRAQRGQG